MILSILCPETTKNIVTICNKKCYTMLHLFFSKSFQIENQNLPIDLDPILNNLDNLKETGNRFLIFFNKYALK